MAELSVLMRSQRIAPRSSGVTDGGGGREARGANAPRGSSDVGPFSVGGSLCFVIG